MQLSECCPSYANSFGNSSLLVLPEFDLVPQTDMFVNLFYFLVFNDKDLYFFHLDSYTCFYSINI